MLCHCLLSFPPFSLFSLLTFFSLLITLYSSFYSRWFPRLLPPVSPLWFRHCSGWPVCSSSSVPPPLPHLHQSDLRHPGPVCRVIRRPRLITNSGSVATLACQQISCFVVIIRKLGVSPGLLLAIISCQDHGDVHCGAYQIKQVFICCNKKEITISSLHEWIKYIHGIM